ncbi:hypothetical protein EXU34_22960 [Alteromonas sp. ZYF713]|nr:hypothetical protein [Alteromonas sp. ZYF713]
MSHGKNITTVFLSLSLIILMITMIKECDGSTAACNGSSAAECQVFVEEEQEFLMDTEEHRRILATTTSNSISYHTLKQDKPTCPGGDCSASKYIKGGRTCKITDRCRIM